MTHTATVILNFKRQCKKSWEAGIKIAGMMLYPQKKRNVGYFYL